MRKRTAAVVAPPDEILECLQDHWVGAGDVPVFYRRGARVLGSNIVGYSSVYWIADGSDDLAIALGRHSLEGTPKPERQHATTPMVEAVKAFSATFSPPGGPGGPTMFRISVGDKLAANHPLALKYKDAFVKVKA
jgi:hypothetical protein